MGAYYFDGWSGPLVDSSPHFKGLLDGQFSGRQPLSGWQDNTPSSISQQLGWAHGAGLSFFAFDWYYLTNTSTDATLNTALGEYLSLKDHCGMRFALMFTNWGPQFNVPATQWKAVCEHWVTDYFTNPEYETVDGQPLLIVSALQAFTGEAGGPEGVNSRIAVLDQVAKEHGLSGVFVVGDIFTSNYTPTGPHTPQVSSLLAGEHYNAVSTYNYTADEGPVPPSGPQPYSALVNYGQGVWSWLSKTSPVAYIPTVAAGWDPRPWNEKVRGSLFWYEGRSAQSIGSFVNDALQWANSHPAQIVKSNLNSPFILISAWNELGEGHYIVPTVDDGFSVDRAIATALGVLR